MNNIKLGILNFQHSNHNYGAVLQAAALEYTCRKMGYDAQHLNYVPQQRKTLRSRVGQLLRFLGLISKPLKKPHHNNEAFERFRVKHVTRSERFSSNNVFRTKSQEYSSIIVGSDQVWRPSYSNDDYAFFLKYVSSNVKRISYAASFGTSGWEGIKNSIYTRKVSDELRSFTAISCREDSGVSICRDVFNVKASHVLDPLLLVDDQFIEDISAESDDKTISDIVYYKLDANSSFERDLAQLSSFYELSTTNIYLQNGVISKYREVHEWLSLIQRSKIVVTDSFHCICLALRFGKEVIFCPNDRRGQARFDSLFRTFHINTIPLGLELETPMYKLSVEGDFETMLNNERSKSMTFLVNALSQ